MSKISCIIPAYNEAPRIGEVLKAVCGHPLIDEIIVVDDCSRDGTKDIAKEIEGVKLIVHEKNKGKSQAIATGVQASCNNLLLFLDADLVGLNAKNITDLVEPVIDGKADIGISLRQNAPWFYRKIGLDFISGERVLPKKIIEENLSEIKKLSCFALESFMNRLIIKDKCRVRVVRWDNVISPWKYKKNGLWAGIKRDIIMTWEILETISPFGVIYQIIKISSLKV